MAAQAPAEARPGGWLVGAAVGVPGHENGAEPGLFTLGVQVTQLQPLQPGLDLAVGIAPRFITSGAFGVRGGVVLPVPAGPALTLLPGGGVSAIVVAGGGIAHGFNIGLSSVIGAPGGGAARVGVSMHWIEDLQAVWLLEVGFTGLFPRR